MGIYVYSLRAKTVTMGQGVPVPLYSYAYKLCSMWKGDYGYNAYQMRVANTERHAEKAMGNRTSVPFVIVGEMKDGIEGAFVYADVTSPVWFDCDRFPGRLVGFVQKVGKGYQISDRTEWSKPDTCKVGRDGKWFPVRYRLVMVNGEATREEVPDDSVTEPPAAVTF